MNTAIARWGPFVLLLVAELSCRPEAVNPSESSAPGLAPLAVSIRSEPNSPFQVIRGAPAPSFRSGDLTVFVTASARDVDRGLPGIAVGTGRGPLYGLLSGYFAPQILAASSSVAYAIHAELTAEDLRVALRTPQGRTAVAATISPARNGRVKLTVAGSADLAFMAARTTVRGTYQGRPSYAFEASAGDRPRVRHPRGDALVVESPRLGPVAIAHDCPRSTIVHPTPRGSTSVFVVRIGRDRGVLDPIYAPPSPPAAPSDRNTCPTETATITLAWPPPG